MGFGSILAQSLMIFNCAQLNIIVSLIVDPSSMSWEKDYLESHRRFEYSYFLVGLLEIKLRTSIPRILNLNPNTTDAKCWYTTLPSNERSSKTLRVALLIDNENPENYLPLSFWRYLLSSKNYGSLWLPTLYQLFPQIDSPKSLRNFKIVDKHLDSALRLRNNVAHYNLAAGKNMSFAQNKVKWLLINLGVDESLTQP